MQRNKDIGLPSNSILYIVIPERSATVIPRNDSDEESCGKDFSLPLEMTVWIGFEGLFELLTAKIPPRRNKSLFTKPSFFVFIPKYVAERRRKKHQRQAQKKIKFHSVS